MDISHGDYAALQNVYVNEWKRDRFLAATCPSRLVQLLSTTGEVATPSSPSDFGQGGWRVETDVGPDTMDCFSV